MEMRKREGERERREEEEGRREKDAERQANPFTEVLGNKTSIDTSCDWETYLEFTKSIYSTIFKTTKYYKHAYESLLYFL